ncbi:hypothetical protein Bealeia1_01433 [Candidatus Bealeia paramacronuclearis]|uniref:Secreted protein n=1 Tax=Candidatus Bealeia paramacronuclearis TaxID=1921001 RepID=A0ABZ2C696_9PROT|nr:hypothetical protein [Candidatus Bealeia paramacronuclearis]
MSLKTLYALSFSASVLSNTLFANDPCCNVDNAPNVTCGWVNKKIYCAHVEGAYYVYILKNNCDIVGVTGTPDTQDLCLTIDPNANFCQPPCQGEGKFLPDHERNQIQKHNL